MAPVALIAAEPLAQIVKLPVRTITGNGWTLTENVVSWVQPLLFKPRTEYVLELAGDTVKTDPVVLLLHV